MVSLCAWGMYKNKARGHVGREQADKTRIVEFESPTGAKNKQHCQEIGGIYFKYTSAYV